MIQNLPNAKNKIKQTKTNNNAAYAFQITPRLTKGVVTTP